MGHRRRHRILAGMFKDVTSIVKATLSAKRNTAKIYISVVHATAHGVCELPSDKRIATVISFGQGSRHTASTCIVALMDRLHGTKNACVALKCLFAIHSIIAQGSFILRDQLSIYPSFGGRNFLNLSKFRHDSDPESWEVSCWVRWYAAVIEQNLTVSRFLGCFLSSSLPDNNSKENKEKIVTFLNKDLLGDIDVLVNFAERICEAPDSLHLQRNDLIYEVVRLVGEDYRDAQHEMSLRVAELRDRIPNLSLGELAQLLDALKKLEDCKERLFLLFVNRTRNDALWELIRETNLKIMEIVVKDENKSLVKVETTNDSSQLTCSGERFAESGLLTRLNFGHEWFSFDPDPLTVSTVTVP